MQTRKSHFVRDEYIFTNINPDRQHDLIYVEQAGITHPDPEYCIVRTREHRTYTYLYVLEYVVEGKGYIVCDGKTYPVQAGDFYFLNRGIEPVYYADSDTPFRKLWVNIAGEFMQLMTASYQLTMPVLVCHFDAEPCMRKLHAILAGARARSFEACVPELLHALIDLFEQIRAARLLRADGEQLYADICRKIERELCFPLSIDQLADDFYISRSTLYRLFMKNCGLSPKQYILGRKIALSQQLLVRNLHSIAEIAAVLQFTDARHFARTFRAQTGVSPAAYRFAHAPGDK